MLSSEALSSSSFPPPSRPEAPCVSEHVLRMGKPSACQTVVFSAPPNTQKPPPHSICQHQPYPDSSQKFLSPHIDYTYIYIFKFNLSHWLRPQFPIQCFSAVRLPHDSDKSSGTVHAESWSRAEASLTPVWGGWECSPDLVYCSPDCHQLGFKVSSCFKFHLTSCHNLVSLERCSPVSLHLTRNKCRWGFRSCFYDEFFISFLIVFPLGRPGSSWSYRSSRGEGAEGKSHSESAAQNCL